MSFHLLSSYFSSLIFYTIYETISNNTFQVGEIQHRVEEFCYFVFICTTKPKYLLELHKYWESMPIEVLLRTVYSLIII